MMRRKVPSGAQQARGALTCARCLCRGGRGEGSQKQLQKQLGAEIRPATIALDDGEIVGHKILDLESSRQGVAMSKRELGLGISHGSGEDSQKEFRVRLRALVTAGDWQSGAALEADGVAAAATLCAGGAQGTAAGIYGNLGFCRFQMRQYDRAIALYEQARAAYLAAGDRAGVGRACCDLGFCYGKMGQYDRAIALHEQARAACEAVGDLAGLGKALKKLEACLPTKPVLRGTCANCGDSVLSTQARGKHPNGDYYHADPKDCSRAPMSPKTLQASQ